jgi:hypothetical protein
MGGERSQQGCNVSLHVARPVKAEAERDPHEVGPHDRLTMESAGADIGRCWTDHSLISFPARALPPFEVALPSAVLPVTAHV